MNDASKAVRGESLKNISPQRISNTFMSTLQIGNNEGVVNATMGSSMKNIHSLNSRNTGMVSSTLKRGKTTATDFVNI